MLGFTNTFIKKPTVFKAGEGSVLDVDWKYMISENFVMARMLRTPDEKLTAEEVLTKYQLWQD